MEEVDLIKEGDYAIIKKENVYKSCQIRRDREIWLTKLKLLLNGAIGHPYGTKFQINKGKLEKVNDDTLSKEEESDITSKDASDITSTKSKDVSDIKPTKDISDDRATQDASDTITKDVAPTKDNRFLIDDSTSQKLTKDDIESLKNKGLSGKEIVQHLIVNSATFKDKNEFSQEKYVKKKHIKYSNYLIILRPTIRLIAEMFYAQGPLRILNVRIDTLAQMLAMCNIHANGRYMVFESCLGLLVASVMERIGDNGNVLHLQTTDATQMYSVQLLNLSKDNLSRLLPLNIDDALQLCYPQITIDETDKSSSFENNKTQDIKESSICQRSVSVIVERDIQRENGALPSSKVLQKKEEREKAMQILQQRNLDGLLVASKYSPIEVLPLLSLLNPSRPFVIYCSYKEPLIECYSKLKKDGNAIFLNLTETWLRKYQIMPQRTHPDINMSGGGGYLLTGITVETNTFK